MWHGLLYRGRRAPHIPLWEGAWGGKVHFHPLAPPSWGTVWSPRLWKWPSPQAAVWVMGVVLRGSSLSLLIMTSRGLWILPLACTLKHPQRPPRLVPPLSLTHPCSTLPVHPPWPGAPWARLKSRLLSMALDTPHSGERGLTQLQLR